MLPAAADVAEKEKRDILAAYHRAMETKDGRYVAAQAVSTLLVLMLVGWVALGIVVIAKTGQSYVGPGDFGRTAILSIEGGFTLLGAGLLAFLASVLQLLMGIWEATDRE